MRGFITYSSSKSIDVGRSGCVTYSSLESIEVGGYGVIEVGGYGSTKNRRIEVVG